ncbi:MAG: HAD hydrolase-like protein [Methanomassiliicoccaceae archaeon]|jgi:phosphoglycolate phosphatase|nr:HAD hydrolase-like protein [Methanomassiliicoccaceae archaeon]
MRYDAVIFDLDGTLIDSSEGIANAAEEAMRVLNYPKMPREELISFIGPPIGNAVIARYGYDGEELKRFNSVFRGLYKDKYLMQASIYPGATELLRDLKLSVFVGIATNKRVDYTTTLLDRLGISRLCDDIQALDMEGKLNKKDLVENSIRTSGISDRKRIVVIGDTRSDESAAKECGADFIGVTYGFGLRNKADITHGRAADSIQSLRGILFS